MVSRLREIVAAPGSLIPGWFPLVADPVSRIVGRPEAVQSDVFGSRMLLDARDYTQRKILYRSFEPHEARLVAGLLQEGDTVVDVGANVGFFTLIAARAVGPEGRVIAFEPIASNEAVLRRNLALNGYDWVDVRREAVGDAVGSLELGLPAGAVSVDGVSGWWTRGGAVDAATVAQTTIDEALGGERAAFVKVDVEGMEEAVLAGAERAIAERRIARVLFEVAPSLIRLRGGTAAELLAPLARAGYRLQRLDGVGRLREVDAGEPKLPRRLHSVLAIAPQVE